MFANSSLPSSLSSFSSLRLSFMPLPTNTELSAGRAKGTDLKTLTPPQTPPSRGDWATIAAAKQADRERELDKYSSWRLGGLLPSADVDDVSEVVLSKLTPREREIVHLDATAILARIRSKECTSVEVLTAFCKVTVAAQETVNCVTEVLFEQGFRRAAELDQHLAATGEVVGPLHGLPVSIKDHIFMKGVDTSSGYVGWAYKTAAEKDAAVVDILRKAGAVLYVKTANPQTLLCLETDNNVYGRTLNPFNRKLSPGGSSGGESALIAAHGSPLGIGTDIGGSVRIPAAYSGLYGLKPSVARLPHTGLAGSHDGMDNIVGAVGPMAHSARDIELFCDVMSQYESWVVEHQVIEIPWRKEIAEGKTLPKKLCFAILWDDGIVKPHPPLVRAMRKAKKALEASGHEVIDWVPLGHREGWELIVKLYQLDAAEEYWATLADTGEPAVPQIEWMLSHSAGRTPYTAADTWKLNVERETFRAKALAHWNATKTRTSTGRPVDAIICPTAPNLAIPHDQTRWWGYTSQWNILDLPGAVFPVAGEGRFDPSIPDDASDAMPSEPRSEEERHYMALWRSRRQDFKGAPITLQLVGRRLNEEKVLAMVTVVQEAIRPL